MFLIFIFKFENCQSSFLCGHPFGQFWSTKYLNFGGKSCEIRIWSRSIQETYTLRKVKKQFLLFQSIWDQICLISWSANVDNVSQFFQFPKLKQFHDDFENIFDIRNSKYFSVIKWISNQMMKYFLCF